MSADIIKKALPKSIKENNRANRSWMRFKENKRGYYSLWIFTILFVLSLFAEILSNDKPLLVYYDSEFYVPVLKAYPETTFGGDFETEADYVDPFVRKILNQNGNWTIYPLLS